MGRKTLVSSALALVLSLGVENASATSLTLNELGNRAVAEFNSDSGLGATAVFTLIDPSTIQIVVTNTSTGFPDALLAEPSDRLLTSVSFQLPSGVSIAGGVAAISAGSQSVNFDAGVFGAGDDVSAEWGAGNRGTTGLLTHLVTAMQSTQSVPFAREPNLDGPRNLSGPQAGLLAEGDDSGGLGAIQNSVTIIIELEGRVEDLSFLSDHGVIFEFGSDAHFAPVPEPGTLFALAGALCVSALVLGRRRRQPA